MSRLSSQCSFIPAVFHHNPLSHSNTTITMTYNTMLQLPVSPSRDFEIKKKEKQIEGYNLLYNKFDPSTLALLAGSDDERIYSDKLAQALQQLQRGNASLKRAGSNHTALMKFNEKRELIKRGACFECKSVGSTTTACACFQADGILGSGVTLCGDCWDSKFTTQACNDCNVILGDCCTPKACNACRAIQCGACWQEESSGCSSCQASDCSEDSPLQQDVVLTNYMYCDTAEADRTLMV